METLEVTTEVTLLVTSSVAPTLVVTDTVSQIQTLEVGVVGPQGPTGPVGPAGPTGTSSMVWTSTTW